jgi:hypothetical protein
MKWIFPREVEWRSYRIRQKRVNIFLIFSRNIIPKLRVSQAAAPPGKPSGFGCRGALRMSLASRSSGDAAGMPLSSANRSELSLMWRMRAPPFHGDNVVTIFAKATEEQSFADRREFFSIFETLCDPHFAQFACAAHLYC